MAKTVILTGIRSNNNLHLGNYLGALKPVVDLQSKYSKTHQINVFVPDLHSFTTPVDHKKLYAQTIDHLKTFVACGLDLNDANTYLYRQSFIPAHSELTVILNNFVSFGELSRMTQFKEKAENIGQVVRRFADIFVSEAVIDKKERYIKNYSGTLIELKTECIDELIRLHNISHRIIKVYKDSGSVMATLNEVLDNFFADYGSHAAFKKREKQVIGFDNIDDLKNYYTEFRNNLGPRGHKLYSSLPNISSKEPATVGLFDYPVLMAADILLYGAKFVPVGDDQTQHLELVRNIAIRFNEKFGKEIFLPPAPINDQVKFMEQNTRLRLRDLANPQNKMSKSDTSDKGIIFLNDDLETAKAKIMAATTDSFNEIQFDFNTRPGISNLLTILAELTNQPLNSVVAKYKEQKEYGTLKADVANAAETFLKRYQADLASVSVEKLNKKVEESETAMAKVANSTLEAVQKAVGLRN